MQETAAAAGDADLDGQHGVEGAVHDGGEVGVAAQHVGLPQRRAQVVAGRDPLLGGGGVVGPGGLLDHLLLRDLRQEPADGQEGDDRGDGEEEGGRPPGQRRDHPEWARRQQGARGLPHAPAHQLADLPGVVVDAVEHLADGLLGELGQRLRHRGVEQVRAQLALGAVADRGPDGLGDGVDDRATHHAHAQQEQQGLGGAVGEATGDHRAQRGGDGAHQGHREAEVGQRAAYATPVDRPAVRRQARRGGGRVGGPGCLGDGHDLFRLGGGTDSAPVVFRPGQDATTPRPHVADGASYGEPQTSKAPDSRRFLTSCRNRPASAPSTRRWS